MASKYEVLLQQLDMQQQIYYATLTQACISDDMDKRAKGQQNLCMGPNISNYMPPLTIFITNGLYRNMYECNVMMVRHFLRMVFAVIGNNNVNLTDYIKELLPAIKYCMLAEIRDIKRLNDHWEQRDLAAHLLSRIFILYPRTTQFMNPVYVQEYINIIGNCYNESMCRVYGAITALGEMGPMYVQMYLIPFIKSRIGIKICMCLAEKHHTNLYYIPALYVKNVLFKHVLPILWTHRLVPFNLHAYVDWFGQLGFMLYTKVLIKERNDQRRLYQRQYASYLRMQNMEQQQ